MKTRADHSAAAPERRGRATGMQLPTRTSAAPVNDSLVRFAADDTTARLQAERRPLRIRAGQGMLMVQGLALGVLGGVALAWSVGFTRFGADGTPLLALKVTPLHAVLLLCVGSVALLACLGRRTAFIFSAFTACGWAALTIVCALSVARHEPGALGFDPRDSLLYGALSAYNLVTSCCLAVFKRRTSGKRTSGTQPVTNG